MSARSEPKACCCRFCGESFTAAGIQNHERWCDQNPHAGTHPDDAPDLFEQETTGGEPPNADADPDQRSATSDGGVDLPPREQLPSGDKAISNDSAESPDRCRACESTDTMPAHSARREFQREMDDPPAGLLATMDAAERYCNACYSVIGGELPEPYCITEGFK